MVRQTDSRTVKALWSIVLGLAMVSGQFSTTAAPQGGGGPVLACACCSCASLNCCGTNSPSLPLSTPTSSATDFRVQAPALTVVAMLSTVPEVTCATALVSCERSLAQHAAVPVYERDCSYLI